MLSFYTITGTNYAVLQNTNLATTNRTTFTNCIGSGSITQFSKPAASPPQSFFRLRRS